jgi:glycosyltransferase involved in cell wall biosynthesis
VDETVCLNPSFATTRRVIVAPLSNLYTLPNTSMRKGVGGLRTKGYSKGPLPERPLVTIVTPVFNGERYLEETIKSVLAQEYDNLEYIIIDGGSTDRTLEIIKCYEDAIDYWVSEPDRGQTDAINKGFSIAQGDILTWLNYDDIYFSYSIRLIVYNLRKPHNSFSYGHCELIDEYGNATNNLFTCKQTLASYRHDKSGNIFQGTVLFTRELWDKYGPLDISLKCAFEYKFFDQFFAHEHGVFINNKLAQYRIHPNTISSLLADNFAKEMIQFRKPVNSMLNAYFRARRIFLTILQGNLTNKLLPR